MEIKRLAPRIALAFMSTLLAGATALYLWIYFSLGRQLDHPEIRLGLLTIAASAFPLGFGFLKRRKIFVSIGIALFAGGLLASLLPDSLRRAEQASREKQMRQEEQATLLARAQETLRCTDGSLVILHSETGVNQGTRVLLLSRILPGMDRAPQVLCVRHDTQNPICRGLERQIKESGLDCAGEKGLDLRRLQSRYFSN